MLDAALATGKKGRRTIGKGREKITPQKVAYVIVLLRFSLSTQEEWAEMHGTYDNIELYNTILSLFEDEEWSQATLASLERRVWGRTLSANMEQHARPTAREILAQQREARRRAQASRE